MFALEATVYQLKRDTWMRSFFVQRRKDRKEFLRLYVKASTDGETAAFIALRHSLSNADSRYYHSLGLLEERKVLNHG